MGFSPHPQRKTTPFNNALMSIPSSVVSCGTIIQEHLMTLGNVGGDVDSCEASNTLL